MRSERMQGICTCSSQHRLKYDRNPRQQHQQSGSEQSKVHAGVRRVWVAPRYLLLPLPIRYDTHLLCGCEGKCLPAPRHPVRRSSLAAYLAMPSRTCMRDPVHGVFRQFERVTGWGCRAWSVQYSTLCKFLPYPMHALRRPEAEYSMQTAEGSMHVDCSARCLLGDPLACGYSATTAHQWTSLWFLHSAKSQRAKCLSVATTCCLPPSYPPPRTNKPARCILPFPVAVRAPRVACSWYASLYFYAYMHIRILYPKSLPRSTWHPHRSPFSPSFPTVVAFYRHIASTVHHPHRRHIPAITPLSPHPRPKSQGATRANRTPARRGGTVNTRATIIKSPIPSYPIHRQCIASPSHP